MTYPFVNSIELFIDIGLLRSGLYEDIPLQYADKECNMLLSCYRLINFTDILNLL